MQIVPDMKMRTVGLLGLVLAHLNAQALPLMCAKAYDRVEREYSQLIEEKQSDEWAGYVGVAGAAAAFAFCAKKSRSLVSGGACAVVFGLIAIVGYNYADSADDLVQRLDDYVLINKAYDYGKNGTALAMRDFNSFLEKAEIPEERINTALEKLVDLMDEGLLCDSLGRPNKSIAEVSKLIKSRLP
jgi:hypothetical protein